MRGVVHLGNKTRASLRKGYLAAEGRGACTRFTVQVDNQQLPFVAALGQSAPERSRCKDWMRSVPSCAHLRTFLGSIELREDEFVCFLHFASKANQISEGKHIPKAFSNLLQVRAGKEEGPRRNLRHEF